MAYHVKLKRKAEKELSQLEPKTRKIITGYLERELEGCENPKAIAGCKKLEGVENGWRWRVGTYRILGTVEDSIVTIEVFRIGPRRDVYRKLPKRP